MRGLIEGAATTTPIAAGLPALYAEDDFAQRLTGALDEVLAPVGSSVDNLAAYLDPRLTPPDFLRWLGRWFAIPADHLDGASTTDVDALRALVGAAAPLGARRGTAAALAEEVRLTTGAAVDVSDSGGVSWSATPGSAPPGTAQPGVRVLVRGPAEPALTRSLVARAVPAHIPVTVTFEEATA